MHPKTLLALLLLSGCLLPKYDANGSRCDEAHPCPNGLACVVGFCGAACESPPAACSGSVRPCLTTLAGSGGPGLVDGTGSAARFRGPTQLLALGDGTLVVSDTGNHALRRITSAGDVTTLAGDGTCDPLDPRSLCEPYALAAGDRGELYITTLGSDSVARVENGQVHRLIGTGLPGEYVRPLGVAYASGRLAVTRTNYCEVRFHELDGGRARDSMGAVVPPLGTCGQMLDGYPLGWLEFVAVSPDAGTLYFGTSSTLWSAPLQKGVPAGPARFVAGWDDGFRDGVADMARFDNVAQLSPGATGVLVADRKNHRLRRIESGSVTTLAGGAAPGIDDGPVASALLAEPSGIAELNGAIWFTSPLDHRVRKLEAGQVTTVAGEPPAPLEDGCAAKVRLAAPSGAGVDPRDGTLYFTDTLHHAVRALGTNGTVVTLVSGPPGYSRDGDFASARLVAPRGVEVLAGGEVVVADTGNGRIVHLDVASRRMTTLVGAARPTGFQLPGCVPSADGAPLAAELCAPKGLVRGPGGELYFTDSPEPGQGKLVRLSADRKGLTELLNAWWFPRGLTLAPNGNIVVTDVNTDEVNVYSPTGQPLSTLVRNDACGHGQHWARRCTPTDVSYLGDELVVLFEGSSTVARRPSAGTAFVGLAGTPFERGSTDGPTGNRLDGPAELTATDGGWVIADTLNHRLRLLLP